MFAVLCPERACWSAPFELAPRKQSVTPIRYAAVGTILSTGARQLAQKRKQSECHVAVSKLERSYPAKAFE